MSLSLQGRIDQYKAALKYHGGERSRFSDACAALMLPDLLAELDRVRAERDEWWEAYDARKVAEHRAIAERDALRAENERLREALREILDLTTGWTRPLTGDERLSSIGHLARAVLVGPPENEETT